MLKKGVGLSVATALLSLGVGQISSYAATTQDQSHTTSVVQSEGVISSNLSNLTQAQKVFNNANQLEFVNPIGFGQGQVGTVSGVQIQTAYTNGPAILNQSAFYNVNLSEIQHKGISGQTQFMGVGHYLSQSTITTNPSLTIQGQIGIISSIQFQASIKGGPTIQNQITHRNSSQYQSTSNVPGNSSRGSLN